MKYTKDQIKVNSPKEQARTRPGWMIGSVENPNHLLYEFIDNAVDERNAGFAKKLDITVFQGEGVFHVRDDGRGIPNGKKTHNGKEYHTVELVCTEFFTSGKFNKESVESAYSEAIGQNGIGMCCQLLTEEGSIESIRDGEKNRYSFIDGDFESHTKIKYKGKDTGTVVNFRAHRDLFNSLKFDIKDLKRKLSFIKQIDPEYEIILTTVDEEDNRKKEEIENSFFPEELYFPPIKIKAKSAKAVVEFFVSWNSIDTHKILSGVNRKECKGTHETAALKAVQKCFERLFSEQKLVALPEDSLLGAHVLNSLSCKETDYSSQTKDYLSKPVTNTLWSEVYEGISNSLYKELTKNKEFFTNKIIPLLKRMNSHREHLNSLRNQKDLQAVIKINKNKDKNILRGSMIYENLSDCRSSDKKGTELFIVEGASAGGTVIKARLLKKLTDTVGVLFMRGKSLNVPNYTFKEASQNKEIIGLINAFGCGVDKDFDIERLRYDKIIILSDSDPDGAEVSSIMLGNICHLFPETIYSGHVYVCETPLHVAVCKKDYIPLYSESFDRSEYTAKGYRITRLKGLGEAQDEWMASFCFDKSKRKLIQITSDNVEDVINITTNKNKAKVNYLRDEGIL